MKLIPAPLLAFIITTAVTAFFQIPILHIELPNNRTTIKLVGAATFIRLPKLASCLENVDAGADLHVEVSEMDYIDRACMELLLNWSRQQAATGGRFWAPAIGMSA